MDPSKPTRSLYFTPRTPWGRYPQNRPGQMAPAAPVQPPKAPPAAQRTPYAPRPAASDRDILRQPGDAAPTVKEQLQRDIDWNRKQGCTSDRDLTLQQKYERDNLMRDTFPSQPEANTAAPKEKHWSGSIGGDGVRGPKEGPDVRQVTIQYSSQPKVQKTDAQKQQNFSRPITSDPVKIDEKEFDEARNPEDVEEEEKQ